MEARTLKEYAEECHRMSKSKGFWDHIPPAQPTYRWGPEKLMLMVSEISEVMEALRNDANKASEKCPELTIMEEEVADVFIRLFDFCGKLGIDPQVVIDAKMAYNATRSHRHGGRKF